MLLMCEVPLSKLKQMQPRLEQWRGLKLGDVQYQIRKYIARLR